MVNDTPRFDCTIVGASFAGLACATALARTGAKVLVLEKKFDVGAKLHTIGIIVKDVSMMRTPRKNPICARVPVNRKDWRRQIA
jgi:flavin-dependent dehydrogenase